uniref:Decaprenyl diphosphate synthase subunit 1 n=1 Tax=Pavo cristatus TaxID=9049 RepID=A0A8C9GA59_PAVCR
IFNKAYLLPDLNIFLIQHCSSALFPNKLGCCVYPRDKQECVAELLSQRLILSRILPVGACCVTLWSQARSGSWLNLSIHLFCFSSQVSILGCPDPKVHEIAYQYGKNVGIAFQLIDDVLDFTSCADHLGKPAAADLKLGLATGPVLFACRQFPEMNAMIMRRFSKPGDVERARKYVLQSDGVQQTTYLAQRYCHEATREISKLRPSPEREALIQLTEMVLMRDK